MARRRWTQYSAVKRYPILVDYIERFNKTSFFNELPGLLSFFYLQGQAVVDYVRIPVWASFLDPRFHVFWIQPTRSGKSISWEFIGEVAKHANLDADIFTSGTDAGLIGSFKQFKDENGDYYTEEVPGLLNGKKLLNFDEGSVLLQPNPKQFFQEVIIYLQQSMNPVGSHSNTLTKHMKDGKIETESRTSHWITTFPPAGVKEYVLTKGLFQRVLLLFCHWNNDMRMAVSKRRMQGLWSDEMQGVKTTEDLSRHFREVEAMVREHLFASSPHVDAVMWEDLNENIKEERQERERIVRASALDMFQKSRDFDPAVDSAIEEFYRLVSGMDDQLSDVVLSFMPNIENYLNIMATHLLLIEMNENKKEGPYDPSDAWIITGDHIDMAMEILYDTYERLIVWLESDLELGAAKAEKIAKTDAWTKALEACKDYDLGDHRGDGWKLKKDVLKAYGRLQDRSKPVVYKHYDMMKGSFKETKVSGTPYVIWKGDGL
tara:strand:+ start:2163 stop:3629 length:1467 start_codon:yes stop_codon:yes gene_type:complete